MTTNEILAAGAVLWRPSGAGVELAVVRRLGEDLSRAGTVLSGTWAGQVDPVPLAYASAG